MISRFLNYVEIKTKITSIFAFLYTLAFILYLEQEINLHVTVTFFASMFLFDLATTAINNYIDSKSNDQVLQFKRSTARMIIYFLFIISTLLGLFLVYLTDVVVFFIGALCFLCGTLYTFGPIPISRQPLGEAVSGIFYGFFIPFILLYINMPEGTFLTLNINKQTVDITIQIVPLIKLFIFSITPMCVTANIMLANNICDLEKDILVKRYTLPYYIGDKSLYLFALIYYATYIATIIMVLFKILSPIYLLSLLTIFLVQKNIKIFFKKQEKDKTFIVSIKNYIIIMATNTLLIFISILLLKK